MLEPARGWRAREVYVPCSGTFRLQRGLAQLGEFELHGNDVTLYSSALGGLATGELVDVRVREPYRGEWAWIEEHVRTPLDLAATVMLCSRMLGGLGKTNAYYERLRGGYLRAFPALHAEAKKNLERARFKLASYTACDAVDWLEAAPADAAVISVPPPAPSFIPDGYLAGMEELFEWPKPAHEKLEEERLERLVELITGREEWAFATPIEHPDLAEQRVGKVKMTTSAWSLPYHVYASAAGARVVAPRQILAPILAPYLTPSDQLGERLALAPLTPGQFAGIRSLYLNANIAPAGAELAFGVLCDGVLVGVFATSADTTSEAGGAYLLSDFPVRPTRYPNLAKLVLCAALSTEAKLLFERAWNRRVRTVVSTAFAKAPVSMKYRGLFQLHSRVELDEGRWQLQYTAPAGRWSLDEGLALWRKRFGAELV